jgi:hypothetical protein
VPVKRRNAKRRVSVAADLFAWETMFEHGYDFFNDAGISHQESTPEAQAAIKDAWRRLGHRFLAERDPNAHNGPAWAVETLGEPPCR